MSFPPPSPAEIALLTEETGGAFLSLVNTLTREARVPQLAVVEVSGEVHGMAGHTPLSITQVRSGRHVLMLNRRMMAKFDPTIDLNDATSFSPALHGLLAHEIGHVYHQDIASLQRLGADARPKHLHVMEFKADRFSRHVLGSAEPMAGALEREQSMVERYLREQSGNQPGQLQALRKQYDAKRELTHPETVVRINALRRG